MYFPYVRGWQFELLAIRKLVEKDLLHAHIVPVIEPVKCSSTDLVQGFVRTPLPQISYRQQTYFTIPRMPLELVEQLAYASGML